jgi:hypothetical protein
MLETDVTVIELDQGESTVNLTNKKVVVEGSLFDISPYNMLNIKDNLISWGFYFDDSTYLDLDSCSITNWNQATSNSVYLHHLRQQISSKAHNHKTHRLKSYNLRVQSNTVFK